MACVKIGGRGETADALASGASESNLVEVQLLSAASVIFLDV